MKADILIFERTRVMKVTGAILKAFTYYEKDRTFAGDETSGTKRSCVYRITVDIY